MLVVGLTGGIASGKSAVAQILQELGAQIIDADRIGREVMAPHTECWEKVSKQFGKRMLGTNLIINRKKLASEIFADPGKRALLNSIVHPFIKRRIDEMLSRIRSADPNALVIVDAALLVETGQYRCYDKLVVVATEEETQLTRIMSRDKLSRKKALRRVSAQLPLAEKKKVADYVIMNEGTLEQTRKQTEALFHALRADQSGKPAKSG